MSDWVIGFIEQWGYPGIALLMLLENVVPPLPSELIMPFAAFQAARGELHWALVILAGAMGSLIGTLPWYLLGRALGFERLVVFADRHGRWLTLSPQEVERAEAWFVRRGAAVLLLGRLVPGVRTVISLPAGVSRLPLRTFLAWTAAGSLVWCSALTAAGYLLESRYERIASVMSPASTGIVVLLLVAYAWRVVRYARRG